MNETGRKTFFWYRVYCTVMALLYLMVVFLGVVLTVFQPPSREYSTQEIMIMGVIYAVVDTFFFLAFAAALFLPLKPYNWIVGIVMMAIGMTSCYFIPFVVPLFFFGSSLKPKRFLDVIKI